MQLFQITIQVKNKGFFSLIWAFHTLDEDWTIGGTTVVQAKAIGEDDPQAQAQVCFRNARGGGDIVLFRFSNASI